MNPRLARLLTRLYPRSWRERYGAEFKELLETGHGGLRASANVAWSGLRERIFPIQGLTLDREPGSAQFRSWCVRAPWAIFCLAPVSLLAGAYFVACLLLWAGWKIFLPGADSPFGAGPRYGFANLYFQFGKYYYGGAPILVSWAIALIAVRQRAKTAWPVIGFVLVSWIGATARIQASRTAVAGGLGHIHMDFALWPSAQNVWGDFIHALMILSLSALPYILWRFQRALPLFP
jgi:hypothetical protein